MDPVPKVDASFHMKCPWCGGPVSMFFVYRINGQTKHLGEHQCSTLEWAEPDLVEVTVLRTPAE